VWLRALNGAGEECRQVFTKLCQERTGDTVVDMKAERGSNKHLPSLGARFRGLFTKTSGDELIGAVLIKKGLITKGQLSQAMDAQKHILFQQGKAVPLGQVVVEQGYAREEDVVRAINDHYDLSVVSLSDNIRDLVRKVRGSLREQTPTLRIPIWLQLSITIIFVMVISMAIFGYVVMERQKDKLFEQTLKQGMISLNYFSNNAKIPLLNDDILELNRLINDAASVEGQFYAFIVDNDGLIKAHTDHEKIDKQLQPFSGDDEIFRKGPFSYFNYETSDGADVLNLSSPVMFREKRLGEVHVGLSVDFVRELFIHERAFLAASILLVILFGMIVAVIFSRRFSKPISTLVDATAEIARGNYAHRVELKNNDEIGTLGEAFNRMGDELYRQSLMKESFGKYVGSEVLDMIMRSPEKGWLKGRKNRASVLFADIRGFTAYSEAKEPEEVVERLNEFFEIATEIVMRFGGYVDKFIGDSVLAVFGVPVYHRNHEARCLQAALAMQKEFAHNAAEGNRLLASVGISVASGVVVAGNIGSPVKTEYTVIGDCVNVAAYLNDLAGGGEIIAAGSICGDCGDLATFEALAPQRVKGKEEVVEIYRVLAKVTTDVTESKEFH